MGQVDGTLIVGLVALLLAAIAVGLALGNGADIRAHRRALKAQDEDASEIERSVEALSNKVELATRTAHTARDLVGEANGVVAGLQSSQQKLRETLAQVGIDLSEAREANAAAIRSAIAEIAELLQGVQVRLANAERGALDASRVDRIERALLVLAQHAGRDAIVERELEPASSAPQYRSLDAAASSDVALSDDEAPLSENQASSPLAASGAFLREEGGEAPASASGESSAESADAGGPDLVMLSPAVPLGALSALFGGAPDWMKPKPRVEPLSAEEQRLVDESAGAPTS